MKSGLSAVIDAGVMDVSEGMGLRTVNVAVFDVPPPGDGFDAFMSRYLPYSRSSDVSPV